MKPQPSPQAIGHVRLVCRALTSSGKQPLPAKPKNNLETFNIGAAFAVLNVRRFGFLRKKRGRQYAFDSKLLDVGEDSIFLFFTTRNGSSRLSLTDSIRT
jgi:hypothetical protein